MKKIKFEKGGTIYKMGDIAKQMFIIQSGFIEVTHVAEGEPFIIEKLYRGSIINHRSFLLNDDNDTDGKCGSTVSLFALDYTDIEGIRKKNAELD
jgi:CRP-like cAMP-binding protein